MAYEWTLAAEDKLVLKNTRYSIRRLPYDPLGGATSYMIYRNDEAMSSPISNLASAKAFARKQFESEWPAAQAQQRAS